MDIKTYSFQELTLELLYQILKLRVDVFVVEQNCPYPEIDNQDQKAIHFVGQMDQKIFAYARVLFEKGGLHIGRIIVNKEERGKGLGIQMMNHCIQYCKEKYPNERIHLIAQAHLESYYQKFGFSTESEPYDWDGILHVDMLM